jgi:hypothetical protein
MKVGGNVICSKASIGGCRNGHGDRLQQADRNILNRRATAGTHKRSVL